MSYEIGSNLSRLREILGDTDPGKELLSDGYLNDLISACATVDAAAVRALRRIQADPNLLMKRFAGFGPMRAAEVTQYQRAIGEMIESIMKHPQVAKSSDWIPDADQTAVGRATDEDGFYKPTDISTYLDEQERL